MWQPMPRRKEKIMGDRANVIVKTGDEQVCLYSHWGGTELPATLRAAMKRGKDRWHDSPYLARVIFCEMVKGQEMTLTGFGISPSIGDGKDKVLTVDVNEQTVQINDKPPMSFAAFTAGSGDW
jgi:hypothetical protein